MQSLNQNELLRLLAKAREHSERNWLAILVGYSHGLRVTEIIRLRARDVADGFVTVKRLKGSLKTTQPLVVSSEPLLSEAEAIERLSRGMKPTDRLFPISRVMMWKLFQRYAEEAGLPPHLRHPHVLKHTTAMLAIATAGVENVRQYLGHRSLSSTGEYLRVNDQQASSAVQSAMVGGIL